MILFNLYNIISNRERSPERSLIFAVPFLRSLSILTIFLAMLPRSSQFLIYNDRDRKVRNEIFLNNFLIGQEIIHYNNEIIEIILK